MVVLIEEIDVPSPVAPVMIIEGVEASELTASAAVTTAITIAEDEPKITVTEGTKTDEIVPATADGAVSPDIAVAAEDAAVMPIEADVLSPRSDSGKKSEGGGDVVAPVIVYIKQKVMVY